MPSGTDFPSSSVHSHSDLSVSQTGFQDHRGSSMEPPGHPGGHTPPPRTAPHLSFTLPAPLCRGLPFRLRPAQAVVGSAGDPHPSKSRGKRGCIRSPGDREGTWGRKPGESLGNSTSRPFPPTAPVLRGVCPRGGAPDCLGLSDVFRWFVFPGAKRVTRSHLRAAPRSFLQPSLTCDVLCHRPDRTRERMTPDICRFIPRIPTELLLRAGSPAVLDTRGGTVSKADKTSVLAVPLVIQG